MTPPFPHALALLAGVAACAHSALTAAEATPPSGTAAAPPDEGDPDSAEQARREAAAWTHFARLLDHPDLLGHLAHYLRLRKQPRRGDLEALTALHRHLDRGRELQTSYESDSDADPGQEPRNAARRNAAARPAITAFAAGVQALLPADPVPNAAVPDPAVHAIAVALVRAGHDITQITAARLGGAPESVVVRYNPDNGDDFADQDQQHSAYAAALNTEGWRALDLGDLVLVDGVPPAATAAGTWRARWERAVTDPPGATVDERAEAAAEQARQEQIDPSLTQTWWTVTDHLGRRTHTCVIDPDLSDL
ncbi:hypothetical protein [Kitasatospora sp. NPDC088783]|uniref:hypothetical protein n=1 Tax=Kitasatospora sp. NPDC088783 TaxID=3364077 RepID=UPI00382D6010